VEAAVEPEGDVEPFDEPEESGPDGVAERLIMPSPLTAPLNFLSPEQLSVMQVTANAPSTEEAREALAMDRPTFAKHIRFLVRSKYLEPPA
jgi:hypothetical protein